MDRWMDGCLKSVRMNTRLKCNMALGVGYCIPYSYSRIPKYMAYKDGRVEYQEG